MFIKRNQAPVFTPQGQAKRFKHQILPLTIVVSSALCFALLFGIYWGFANFTVWLSQQSLPSPLGLISKNVGCGYTVDGYCYDGMSNIEAQKNDLNYYQGPCSALAVCSAPFVLAQYQYQPPPECEDGQTRCGQGCCPNTNACCDGVCCGSGAESCQRAPDGTSSCVQDCAARLGPGAIECGSGCCPSGSECYGCYGQDSYCEPACPSGQSACEGGIEIRGPNCKIKICCDDTTYNSCSQQTVHLPPPIDRDVHVPVCTNTGGCPGNLPISCGSVGGNAVCCAADQHCIPLNGPPYYGCAADDHSCEDQGLVTCPGSGSYRDVKICCPAGECRAVKGPGEGQYPVCL